MLVDLATAYLGSSENRVSQNPIVHQCFSPLNHIKSSFLGYTPFPDTPILMFSIMFHDRAPVSVPQRASWPAEPRDGAAHIAIAKIQHLQALSGFNLS